MDLNNAIAKHAEWKMKFRFAMNKEEVMDAVAIASDRCCDLGQWLHGDAKTRHGQLASYMQCVAKHAAFHAEAGKVARVINSKKYTEAEAMMDAGTAYATASNAVGVAIMALKKDAGL